MAYKEWRLGKGLNLKVSPDLIGEDELLDADGCWFDEPGCVSSEPGRTTLATLVTTGQALYSDWRDSIIGIGEGVTEGNRYLFIANRTNWVRLDFDDGANETQILNLAGASDQRTNFVSNREHIYGANGFRFLRYKPTQSLFGANPSTTDASTGYLVNETLTVTGGTATTTATLTITEVDDDGAIVEVIVSEPGEYTALPTNPNSPSGGSGSGAVIDLWLPQTSGKITKVGCAKPALDTGQTPTESGTGSSVAGNVHKWVVTYFNGVAESNFSEPLEYTIVGSNNEVVITIPVDTQALRGTLSRRIYRTDNNGSEYYFVGEVPDNTTVTFTDPMGLPPSADPDAASGDDVRNEPRRKPRLRRGGWYGGRGYNPIYNPRDPRYRKQIKRFSKKRIEKQELIASNLGWLADWTDHDQPQEGFSRIGSHRNLVIANDVIYSIFNDTNLMFCNSGEPEHWPIWNEVPVGEGFNPDTNTGEKLQTILPMSGDIICYTDRGVWQFRRQGVDALQSTLKSVDATVGCVSQRGATSTDNHGHFFMSKDGIYAFDGRRANKVSHGIEDLFTDSSNPDYVDPALVASVCAGSYDKYILFSYRSTSAGAAGFNDKTIRLDLTEGEPKWSVSQIGYSDFHHDSKGRLIAGDENSKVYVVDGGGDTENVRWTAQTGYRNVRSALTGERPQILYVDADFAGISTTVSLLDPDGNTIDSFTSTQNGRGKIKRLLPLGNTYERVSLKCATTGATGTRKLYGWGLATDEAEID